MNYYFAYISLTYRGSSGKIHIYVYIIDTIQTFEAEIEQ